MPPEPDAKPARAVIDPRQSSIARPLPDIPLETFLRSSGFPPASLDKASRDAARLRIGLDEVLIKTGLVSEDTFYRLLAGWLGLRFSAEVRVVPLPGNADPDDLIRCSLAGVARVCPGYGPEGAAVFALAPYGTSLARILKLDLSSRADLVMTTPSALLKSLRLANSRWITSEVAGFGRRSILDRSAYQGLAQGQAITLATFAGVIPPGLLFNPNQTITLLAVLAGPIFAALVALRLHASLIDLSPDADPRVPDRDLPVYTVVIPLFRERRVLPQLLRAIARLDYPRPKLDVKIVVERDDHETRHYLDGQNLPAYVDILVVPQGQPRTKPRALNAALLEARGQLLTIYDAEDVPDPSQLRQAAACFAAAAGDVICVQAHLVIDNLADSWLSRCFALEYAALFDVINPGLLAANRPILLGGTSNHFRTEALASIGGWDAWNVTEDADLSFRLVRNGYRIAELNSTTLEEAPATYGIWMRQRSRWMKGYMQTLLVHGRKPGRLVAEAGVQNAATLIALSLGTVISALGYPFFAAALLLDIASGTLLTLDGAPEAIFKLATAALFAIGTCAMILPAVIAARRRNLRELGRMVPVLPFYYMLVSLAAWRGLYELVIDPHRWNKTDHGLARTSSYGRPPRPQVLKARPATPGQRRPGSVQD